MQLDPQTQKNVQKWLNGAYDESTKAEIQKLIDSNDTTELTDSFYKDLEFGTGGLRGLMGVGSNKVNRYTIGTATQGLANFLNKKYLGENIAIAISYDSRNNSSYFAQITADVCSANGIKVYLFNELRPTPLLSFAVRKLSCKAGVMLTASHNPKEYNGYKAYGADGCQFTSPDDKLVMNEVLAIDNINNVKFDKNEQLIEKLTDSFDSQYLEKIAQLSLSKDTIQKHSKLKIVYSPIHGTGITLVPKSLAQLGFKNVTIVEEQSKPDGNFPTVVYPNPEEREALTLALKKAEEIDADLVLATDPDADRVGAAIKNNQNEFVLLTGNQVGSLLANYLITRYKELDKIKGNEFIVSTVVSTPLIKQMCAANQIEYFDTLTGFKWIGKIMTEQEDKKHFIFGGEESYGYLIGDLVRDKDAVVSCAFIAEMTAYYKDKGLSLFDALAEMYSQYGFYKENLISLTKKGKSGADEIKAMMEKFRNNPPSMLGGSKVITLKDYELGVETNLISNDKDKLDFPKSDVLQFITEDGSIISARPSGTEPKIKFYCSVNTPLEEKNKYHKTEAYLLDKIDTILEELQA